MAEPILQLETNPQFSPQNLTYQLTALLQQNAVLTNNLAGGRIVGRRRDTAAPTTGGHNLGDIMWNSAPAELGSVSSKYVIIGWICTAAGTPGTWLEMRTLTGN